MEAADGRRSKCEYILVHPRALRRHESASSCLMNGRLVHKIGVPKLALAECVRLRRLHLRLDICRRLRPTEHLGSPLLGKR